MRIAFTGASGTGKTTLAKWVSETYGLLINPIGSRSIAKAMGFENPYDVDKVGKRGEFQRRLQREKIIWELSKDDFVTDRTTLDELTYTVIHDFKSVDRDYFERAYLGLDNYDLIFYCPAGAFLNVGDDPARISDLTYHEVYDRMLFGFFRGHTNDVFDLAIPDLENRKQAIDKQIRYRK